MKNTFCKRLKKSVSAILAAAMSLSLFTAIPVSADIGRTTYNYDGYSVDYNVTNEWDGAQTVELTVSNTGTDSILNWALKYDTEGEISNIWNADLYEQNGDEYVIKNVGWNFEIAPSQSVTYG
ncbi:MAG: cellulose-binding domain-containing protein, partial [Eubacterium sp.]|nr:cellulose-binding domain-containing protein [Eubacterium sp.]